MKKVLTRHLVSTAVVVGALAAAGLAGAQTGPSTGPVVVCGFPVNNTKPAKGTPVRIGTPITVGQRVLILCRTVSGRPLVKIVGSVTDLTPKSITVGGVTCAFPTNTKPASGLPVRIGSNVSCRVQVNVVGTVTDVTPKTVTVSGVTCSLPSNAKPKPAIMLHARVGNHVAMACRVGAGQLNVTKLLKR